MEDITDADYAHAQRLCSFSIKHLGEHQDALLLANVSENFRNMCLEIYEGSTCKIFLSMASNFKKD